MFVRDWYLKIESHNLPIRRLKLQNLPPKWLVVIKNDWLIIFWCLEKRILRSLPKYTSHNTTMIARIEKAVEASTVGLNPCLIYQLQRVCFQFDFLEFWTVNSFH